MRIITKEVQISGEVSDVLNELIEASSQFCSEVKQISSNRIECKTRYGAQFSKIPVKIIAKQNNNYSDITFIAWSDDVWGGGAKSAINRILEFHRDKSKIASVKDKFGMNPIFIALTLTLFSEFLKNLYRTEIWYDIMNTVSTETFIVFGVLLFGYRFYTQYKFKGY